MIVLGISAFYHDSAAAIVRDGEIIAAAQEERFTRKKNDAGFPSKAIAYCLQEAGLTLEDVDAVGFYDKPLLTFNRLLETYLAFAPRGLGSFIKSMPVWLKEKLLQKSLLAQGLSELEQGKIADDKILFGFHHRSHAASAFYPSPFEDAAVMVLDGVGEWATTSLAEGEGATLRMLKEIAFPHSIGLLYSAFTYYLGFKVNEGEYKIMGLAPYGEPRYVDLILDKLVDLKADGSFRLDQSYFNYCTGLTMTNDRFSGLFDAPPRKPTDPLTQRHMDLARSVQVVAEEIVLRLARTLHQLTGRRNLCLAGGVALNCVANGRLLREGPFENVWVQPAAGDAGGAIGIALDIVHNYGNIGRPAPAGDAMKGAYLGPSFRDAEVAALKSKPGAIVQTLADDALFSEVARAIAEGKVVGWHQGRMEFGPRALGNRSILGDPRSEKMQRVINLKIKYRESFRPFAPAVLREDVAEWFGLDEDSPYMLIVAPVAEKHRRVLSDADRSREGLAKLDVARSTLPAITHVDDSARVQTVSKTTNPRFHRLIEEFKALTGCGVLINTSFNVRDEPVVCTPEDSWRCFMATEMDMLVIGNTVFVKEEC